MERVKSNNVINPERLDSIVSTVLSSLSKNGVTARAFADHIKIHENYITWMKKHDFTKVPVDAWIILNDIYETGDIAKIMEDIKEAGTQRVQYSGKRYKRNGDRDNQRELDVVKIGVSENEKKALSLLSKAMDLFKSSGYTVTVNISKT